MELTRQQERKWGFEMRKNGREKLRTEDLVRKQKYQNLYVFHFECIFEGFYFYFSVKAFFPFLILPLENSIFPTDTCVSRI